MKSVRMRELWLPVVYSVVSLFTYLTSYGPTVIESEFDSIAPGMNKDSVYWKLGLPIPWYGHLMCTAEGAFMGYEATHWEYSRGNFEVYFNEEGQVVGTHHRRCGPMGVVSYIIRVVGFSALIGGAAFIGISVHVGILLVGEMLHLFPKRLLFFIQTECVGDTESPALSGTQFHFFNSATPPFMVAFLVTILSAEFSNIGGSCLHRALGDSH